MATCQSTFTLALAPLHIRKNAPYRTSSDESLPLGYELVPQPIDKTALISQVTMQDHSMSPTFWAGDILTIDCDMEARSGCYLLIQLGGLLLVRRFIYTEGESDCYKASDGHRPIVDDEDIVKHWGVVTAVEHVSGRHPKGRFEEFDLDKLEMYGDDESKETEEEIAKVKAHFEAAVFA
jgi:Peptidase S24-like